MACAYKFNLETITDDILASIKPKSTWTLLKPHVEHLVSAFVFPQLAFNASKQSSWESDPVEYLRASIGTSRFFFLPVK